MSMIPIVILIKSAAALSSAPATTALSSSSSSKTPPGNLKSSTHPSAIPKFSRQPTLEIVEERSKESSELDISNISISPEKKLPSQLALANNFKISSNITGNIRPITPKNLVKHPMQSPLHLPKNCIVSPSFPQSSSSALSFYTPKMEMSERQHLAQNRSKENQKPALTDTTQFLLSSDTKSRSLTKPIKTDFIFEESDENLTLTPISSKNAEISVGHLAGSGTSRTQPLSLGQANHASQTNKILSNQDTNKPSLLANFSTASSSSKISENAEIIEQVTQRQTNTCNKMQIKHTLSENYLKELRPYITTQIHPLGSIMDMTVNVIEVLNFHHERPGFWHHDF